MGEIRESFRILREVNRKVDWWMPSDMLDPNHNAHGNYYLVQGDFAGSWKYGQFRKPARLA